MAHRATTRPVPVDHPAHQLGRRPPGDPSTPDPGPPGGAPGDTSGEPGAVTGSLVVDCDTCVARGPGCPDCVVTVLLGMPAPRLRIEHSSVRALDVLARSGLVPPLRHDQVG